MKKKLLAIFSALLIACSLGAVGMSVSALDNSKTAIEIANVNYDPDTMPAAGYGNKVLVAVNFDTNTATGNWWTAIPGGTENVIITTSTGSQNATYVESCGASIAVNRMQSYIISVGDIITFKAGWVIGDYEFKEDVHYKYESVGSSFVKVANAEGEEIEKTAFNVVSVQNNVDTGMLLDYGKMIIVDVAPINTNAYWTEIPGATDYVEIINKEGGHVTVTSVETCGTSIAINRTTGEDYAIALGDTITLKAGLSFGEYELKEDVIYEYKTNGFWSLKVNTDEALDMSVNEVRFFATEWGTPALQVTVNIGGGAINLAQYTDALDGVEMEYQAVGGETVNPPEFTYLGEGSNNFLIRPTITDSTFVASVGDKFTIKAGSYIADGGEVYAIDADLTYILLSTNSCVLDVYKENTVTFDANGGTLVGEASQTIWTGDKVEIPSSPTKDADAEFTYEFAGWTLNDEDYDFETLVTGDITLVADWTATPVVADPVPETLTATYTETITAGEKINPAGISIVLTYDDDSTEPVNAGIVEYWYNGEQIVDPINYVFGEELIGTVNITVKYEGLEATMTVEVVAPTDPEDPEDPPVDPEDPTDPEDPVDPPVDPEDPTDPEDPEDPPVDPEEPDNVAVTDVVLNVNSIELVVGGTYQLTATITPNNATNTNVIWISNDTSIATVDANGNVTAVSAGTTVIFVETVDGGLRAGCAITVTADTTPDTPENPETPDAPQGGCGSAIGSVFIPSMVALIGAGIVVAKKKRK